jgi:hypothetical protein
MTYLAAGRYDAMQAGAGMLAGIVAGKPPPENPFHKSAPVEKTPEQLEIENYKAWSALDAFFSQFATG